MKTWTLLVIGALIAATASIKAEESEEAKIVCKLKFIRLRKDANVFGTDYTNPHFVEIPKPFEGRQISLHDPESDGPLTFKVKKAGMVTLSAQSQDAGTLTARGWVRVGEIKVSGGTPGGKLLLFQKMCEVGEYTMDFKGRRIGLRLIK